jgi:hypothetical protein
MLVIAHEMINLRSNVQIISPRAPQKRQIERIRRISNEMDWFLYQVTVPNHTNQ